MWPRNSYRGMPFPYRIESLPLPLVLNRVAQAFFQTNRKMRHIQGRQRLEMSAQQEYLHVGEAGEDGQQDRTEAHGSPVPGAHLVNRSIQNIQLSLKTNRSLGYPD